MDCWSFNPYQLFGSTQKEMMKNKNIKKKNVYFRFSIIQVGKRKHMYRHLYMRPTKKGKPQITDVGSGEVDPKYRHSVT